MRFLFVAFMLVAIAPAQAAGSLGGRGGLGFSCNVNTRQCTCEGVAEGADCQAMKKNCNADGLRFCWLADKNKWTVCCKIGKTSKRKVTDAGSSTAAPEAVTPGQPTTSKTPATVPKVTPKRSDVKDSHDPYSN